MEYIVLFSYESIVTGFTDQPEEDHVVLKEVAETCWQVVTNGRTIQQMLSACKQISKIIIAYTSKPQHIIIPILQALDPYLQWITIQSDKQLFPHIYANHAFLKDGVICYGEGFSTANGKEEVRMAVHSALNEFNRNKFVMIEGNAKQAEILKKEGYRNIFDYVPQEHELLGLMEEEFKGLEISSEYEELLNKSDTLEQCLKTSQFILEQKKYFSQSGNLKLRPPSSRAICSLLLFDKENKLFIAKTDLPKDIGGYQYQKVQENKLLACAIHQILNCPVLPHYTHTMLMRHSLVQKYNKKKGFFVVRPFVRDCVSLGECGDVEGLVKRGEVLKGRVFGLGALVLLSMVLGERFKVDGLLAHVGLGENSCYRLDFAEVFQPVQTLTSVFLTQSFPSVELRYFSEEFFCQMNHILHSLTQNLPLIKGIFLHPQWQTSKHHQFKLFTQNLQYLQEAFSPTSPLPTQFKTVNPLFYKYLINEDYSQFTNESIHSFFEEPQQNPYTQAMRKGENFLIYGSMVGINKLLRWSKNFAPSVQYLSMLTSKPQNYITKIKSAKLDKAKPLFIVDHCDWHEKGDDEKSLCSCSMGLKTIFIYRFTRSTYRDLFEIEAKINNQQPLAQSQDELFQAIWSTLPSKIALYDKYDFAITQWIKHKCALYNMLAEDALELCKKLHLQIKHSKNRLLSIEQALLYTLPVHIQKRRIYFLHDIGSFLSAKYLIESLLGGQWSGRLMGDELMHLKKWYLQLKQPQIIIQKLLQYLHNTSKGQNTDVVEMLRELEYREIFVTVTAVLTFGTGVTLSFDGYHVYGRSQSKWVKVVEGEGSTLQAVCLYEGKCDCVSVGADAVYALVEGRLIDGMGNYVMDIKGDNVVGMSRCWVITQHSLQTIHLHFQNTIISLQLPSPFVSMHTITQKSVIVVTSLHIILLEISMEAPFYKLHPITTLSSEISKLQVQPGMEKTYLGYIQGQKLVAWELCLGACLRTECYTLQVRPACFGFNSTKPELYFFEANSDVMFVCSLPDCRSRTYYRVEKMPQVVFGNSEALYVGSGFGYLKKIIL